MALNYTENKKIAIFFLPQAKGKKCGRNPDKSPRMAAGGAQKPLRAV
jgi:hypothetical protein